MAVAAAEYGAPPTMSGGAATLGLLNRHRQARELLKGSSSTGALPSAGSRPPRPQSAHVNGRGPAVSHGTSSSSSSSGFSSVWKEAAAQGLMPPRPLSASASRLASSTAAAGAVRNPYTAGASSGARVRPTSAGALMRRPQSQEPSIPEEEEVGMGNRAFSSGSLPRQGTNLVVPPAMAARTPPFLPPLPDADSFPKHIVGAVDADAEEDFTAEELRLEQEVEQALSELEAVDSASSALRLQLENSNEDVQVTARELAHLRGMVGNWEKAAEDGRRELAERQDRLDDLLATLPAAAVATVDNGSAACAAGEASDEKDRRDKEALAREARRQDLAAERMHVLEGQTGRLEDQVAEQQLLLKKCTDERQRLSEQAEVMERERNALRMSQREARDRNKLLEAQVRSREDAVAALAKTRQTLERQAVQLKGEANGLRVRLPTGAGSGVTATAPAKVTKVEAEVVEDGRAMSLRLQREVVALWAEIKAANEEVSRLQENLERKDPETVPKNDAV